MIDSSSRSFVVARCITCGNERKIGPNEISPDDHPMCSKCLSPMVAVEAVGSPTSSPDG
jgi:hypothetical protein